MPTSAAEISKSPLPYGVDAEVGDALIAVKFGVDSQRSLGGAMMQLALALGERPGSKGFLVLVDSAITVPRLQEEWTRAAQILRPEIHHRLKVCIQQETHLVGVPEDPDSDIRALLANVVEEERGTTRKKRAPRSTEPFYDILRILINQWIKRAGPLTSRWLAEAAGCTYPTVASALGKLEKYLTRHSDRRVELKAFPEDEWFRLVANADKVRQTLRFADRSGQPRSIESLVSRFERVRPEGTAIGGVLGARRMFPAFDLIGTPRLDLSIHSQARKPDLEFVRQLDPALKPARYDEPARLVIHTLRCPHSFFETTPDGTMWADPVECLLDLHEIRLESQAAEFLRFLTPSRMTDATQ